MTKTGAIMGNYQVQRLAMETGSISGSYMRLGRDPRQQEHDFEQPMGRYSPSSMSSSSNDASGYDAVRNEV